MAKKQKVAVGNEPIYDAKQLGVPKMLILGFQHTFAMFGATVLVPLLTGLDIA
ncbi:MAG: uracil-xanthine permease, partial [Clostridia bacterium]|nr:uracil-xanthine permease [Clostridia bacterium]